LWLAKVGRERIDEIEDPEIGIDRLLASSVQHTLFRYASFAATVQ